MRYAKHILVLLYYFKQNNNGTKTSSYWALENAPKGFYYQVNEQHIKPGVSAPQIQSGLALVGYRANIVNCFCIICVLVDKTKLFQLYRNNASGRT